MVDRRIKRPDKEKALREKLGDDKYEWAWEIQNKPFPDWSAAFDHAYKLGLKRGQAKCKLYLSLTGLMVIIIVFIRAIMSQYTG